MANRSFRDRFLTPKVAEAIMSPLGIVAAGAGAAVGIVAGAPIVLAAGIGVAAWATRVAVAIPQNPRRPSAPTRLSEPWRGYAAGAEDAKKRFDRVVNGVAAGPLRDRLTRLGGRLEDGVGESWRIAQRGQQIVEAAAAIDTVSAAAELAELRRAARTRPSAETEATREALEAQLATAARLSELAEQSRDRLRLLDARFDELVARTIEVSVGTGDSSVLGNDVDQLVSELEALRVAMDETTQAESGAV